MNTRFGLVRWPSLFSRRMLSRAVSLSLIGCLIVTGSSSAAIINHKINGEYNHRLNPALTSWQYINGNDYLITPNNWL